MTKKDYILIASAIKLCIVNSFSIKDFDAKMLTQSAYNDMINQISTVLKENNPLFDRERFLSACGVK